MIQHASLGNLPYSQVSVSQFPSQPLLGVCHPSKHREADQTSCTGRLLPRTPGRENAVSCRQGVCSGRKLRPWVWRVWRAGPEEEGEQCPCHGPGGGPWSPSHLSNPPCVAALPRLLVSQIKALPKQLLIQAVTVGKCKLEPKTVV